MNRLKNTVNFVLEQAGSDNDSIFVDLLSPFGEDSPEVVGVRRFLVDKIELAVDMQALDTVSVQPLGCR